LPVSQRIADYALLGDCHSAALVGRDGSVDWWCPPRFDARSVFARLLGADAGHWSIRPSGLEVERVYLEDTMVLRTTFRTSEGSVRLTDALALAPGVRGHDLGRDSPHALVRWCEGWRARSAWSTSSSRGPSTGS
jgi:GH15 family glucan-1,4-alpha-glucosidase